MDRTLLITYIYKQNTLGRVRNSANPADKSIFYCNLKPGLLKLQLPEKLTRHMQTDQDNVSLAGMLQGAVVRPVCFCLTLVFARHCWVIIRVFQSVGVPWTQFLRQFNLASRLSVGHISQG